MSGSAGRRAGARRGGPDRAVPAALALLLVSVSLTACHHAPAPPPSPTGPLAFGPTGIDGGGFVNVVAYDPSGSRVVLAGGDVSGILRSTDFGRTWAPANTGFEGLPELKVASLLFSSRVRGEVYAAVGDEGRVGGLLVSTDDGRTWSLRSSVPRFSGGNNEGTPLPYPHPRSTGTLLASDPSRGLLYAATFHQGIMRSSDDGRTWTTLGLAGAYLRGLALDPTHPDDLYAAAFGDGVYRTTTGSSTGPFTRLAGSPTDPEELAIVSGTIYAAAGRQGVMSSSDGGTTWRSSLAGGPTWEAIAGYTACGRTVVYAGADGGGTDAVVRSTDGGATWTPLADRARIRIEEGGPHGRRWWLASLPEFLLGGSVYTASQIAIDPVVRVGGGCLHPRVLVAGRSGIWGTTDAGSTWFPMVRGLAVTIAHAVVVDPGSPADLVVAASDWGSLTSSDGGATIKVHPARGTGFAVSLDTASGPPILALGVGSPLVNRGGEVLTASDPLAPRWTRMGLAQAAGGRVLAVAGRRLSGGTVWLAAVDGEGIWRKVGDGAWSHVVADALPHPEGAGGVSLAWAAGSSVFLYDRQTGLWRSADAGATWTQIWANPSPTPFTGWMALDPTAPGRVFVSIGDDGLYRLDGAGTGTVGGGQIHPAKAGGLPHPGPVTVSARGIVYAVELAVDGAPDLLMSPDHGGRWASVADATYRASAVFPLGLTASPNGDLYVALDGNGVLVGRPGD